jgi:hypothetical protein
MRFAPRRSERSVAVATAKSSLNIIRRGVRLDTSLGFLMKLASAFVHAYQLSPGSSWLIFLPEKGWLLGCESCFCFWLGLNCIA